MDSPKQYLTEKEVSQMIRRALSTLRNDRSCGRGIPYIKLGRSVRYDMAEVIRVMDEHKIQTLVGGRE